MKLYNVSTSNFAAKSRIAIYDKGLPIDIVPIPGNDLKSPEYLKINFLGKTPALDADGLMIPESETINEYLEDKFPAPPLLPKSPEGRARVRMFTRFHDLYLTSTQEALALQLNPQNRNEKLLNEKLAEQNLRLDQLDAMLQASGFAARNDFTLADCALAPTIFFAVTMLPILGAGSPLEGRSNLASWWTHVQTRPSVQRALSEIKEGLAAMQRGR
jgi:glutathione S-transferase